MTNGLMRYILPGVCTLIFTILLLLTPRLRYHRRQEEKLLFYICLINLAGEIMMMFCDISLQLTVNVVQKKWALLLMGAVAAREIIVLLVAFLFLVCVDYLCNRSMDHIRRKYRLNYYIVAAVGILFFISESGTYLSEEGGVAYFAFTGLAIADDLVVFFLQLVLALQAYFILREYDAKRKPPRMLKLSGIVVPCLIGWCLYLLPMGDCRGLGTAFAVACVLFCLKNRSRYMDEDNGFYNRSFLLVMNEHLESKGFLDGSALAVSALPEKSKELAVLLARQCPEDGEIFSMGDGSFLYVSASQTEGNLKFLAGNLAMAAKSIPAGFEVQTVSCHRSAGESTKDYTERLLALFLPAA